MKPTASDITTMGNLGGQKVQLSMDENSLVHIMTHLAGLYSDKELAVIREIATNAYDANVAAGSTAPIEVSLPNAMSPYYTVKDSGIGMSVDDLINVYSKYGASTKRNSNDVVGMLGFGCKAPLAYADSFTIVSVKNGVRATAVMSRDESGAGSLTVVDTSSTTDPNGTTVKVPVNSDYYSFNDRANNFFLYWAKDSVLFNGEPPMSVTDYIGVSWLNDKIMLLNGSSGNDIIVMGNVPYQSQRFYENYGYRDYRFVYFADIGEVNFPPSREALKYDKLTTATVEKIRRDVEVNLPSIYQSEIDAAPSHLAAQKVKQKWRNFIRNDDWAYRGEKFANKTTTFSHYVIIRDADRHSTSTDRLMYSRHDDWPDTSDETLIVEKFGLSKVVRNHVDKLRKYNPDLKRVYFTDGTFDDPWLDDLKRVAWADVKKMKVATTAAGRPKIDKEHAVASSKGHLLYLKESDLTKYTEIKYEVMGEFKWSYNHANRMNQFKRTLGRRFANDTTAMVFIKSNDEAKFLVAFPHATKVVPGLIKEYEKTVNALTDEQRRGMVGERTNGYKKFDLSKIDDPEAVTFIENERDDTKFKMPDGFDQLREINELLRVAGYTIAVVEPSRDQAKVLDASNPMKKYRLLENVYYYGLGDLEHIYIYMNAYYKENKK